MLQKRIIKKAEKPTQRDLQKLKTRERIYEAAKELFIFKGYMETRSGDIAKLAGVSHGSIFSHFKSKSDILERLHNELIAFQIKEVENQCLDGIATKERLILLIDLLWAGSRRNVKLGKVMFAQGWLWDEAREIEFQKLTGRILRIGEKIFLEGQKKGEVVAGLNIVAATETIHAQFKESLRVSFLGPKYEAPAKKQLHNLIDILCRH